MEKSAKSILDELLIVKGLLSVYSLTDNDKKVIINIEEPNNIGVKECLNKKIVLAVIHDSDFREPYGSMAIKENGLIIFPPLPFHEIKNSVSSSPSKKVHDFLKTKFNIKLTEEHATLILGID